MTRLALMTSALLVATAFAPIQSFAAGSEDDTPPVETETTTECEGTQVWDEEAEECVDAVEDEESRLDDDARYRAVRELAYAGQYGRAMGILGAFENTQDDRRLTYLGFVNRKMGNVEEGMRWYSAALQINPDNLLARSYMGQALLEQGDRAGAQAQLTQIRARGGRQTWAELALNMALNDGPAPSY